MRHIVLDTNVIFSDFWLRKAEIRTLLNNISELNISFCIPEVVIDESVNCYRKSLEDTSEKFKNIKENFENLLNTKFLIEQANIVEKVEEYRSFLLKTFIGFNCQILEYPKVEHKEIAERAILRTRPFKEFKKKVTGYRDTLIWMTILKLAQYQEEIIFITNNSNDFLEDNSLNKDLKNDLKTRGVSLDILRVYRTINEFFQKEIKDDLETIDKLEEKFFQNKIEGLEYKTLIENVWHYYESWHQFDSDWHSPELPFSNDYNARAIDFDGNIKELVSVWKIESDEYAFSFFVDATIEFEYFVNKYEAHGNFEGTKIQDRDWNEHVMLVSYTQDVSIDVTVVFDIKRKLIIDIECSI